MKATADLFAASFSGPEHRTYTLQGSNRAAALIIHGFPGTPAETLDMANLLHGAGWTVHAPLLPGFGPEIAQLAERGLSDWTATLAAAYADLKRTHDRVLLVGHSMGGALAIAAAAAHPVDGLLLLAPFWEFDTPIWKVLPLLTLVFKQVKPFSLVKMDFNDPEARAGMRQFMPDADLDDPAVQEQVRQFTIPTSIFKHIHAAGQAAHAAAPRVAAPTLVIQGSADELVVPAKSRALAARLKARYTEIPGEHNIPLASAASWGALAPLVAAFAAECLPTPA